MSLADFGRRIQRDVTLLMERRRRLTADPVDPLPGDDVQGMPTKSRPRQRREDTAAPALMPYAPPTVPNGMPVQGRRSSSFGMRMHPVHKEWRPHKGEDIVASAGTPVRATADGRVTQAWRAGSFGNLVEIDHGGGYVTRYAHLSSIAVRFRQEVARGDTIGAVGMTGTATGPHLHYEVLVRGKQVDPDPFL